MDDFTKFLLEGVPRYTIKLHQLSVLVLPEAIEATVQSAPSSIKDTKEGSHMLHMLQMKLKGNKIMDIHY